MHERVQSARFSRDPEELYQIGLMFRDGIEVKQDYKEANNWFRRASYSDHPGALFNLAVISAKKLASSFSSQYEVDNWLNKSAGLNHEGAKKLKEMIAADKDKLPDAELLFSFEKTITAEESATEGSPTEEPTAKEPTAEEPTAEEPTAEEPAADVGKFNKDLSYATTEYQPSDLADYKNEPWDIRISIDNAPLDDAFYFTVKDSGATSQTIKEVLEKYALNISLREELDVEEFPKLPHVQQELLGYYESGKADRLNLNIYVNKRPSSEPVSPEDKVSDHLSTCIFNDGTYDYRLLDLIFVLDSKPLASERLKNFRDEYGAIYMLFLIDYLNSQPSKQNDSNNELLQEFANGSLSKKSYPIIQESLNKAVKLGWISVEKNPTEEIIITADGHDQIKLLLEEVSGLTQEYEPYQSVSINPPTLGVPDGIDVRLQIMRFSSVDVNRAIFLFAYVYDKQALFGDSQWADGFETGDTFSAIIDALQYETKFSQSILDGLIQLKKSQQ